MGDFAVDKALKPGFPIVGSGASAGGLEELFHNMPVDTGWVQRGFDQKWLDHWVAVDESQGVRGAVLRKGERVIIEDVRTSPVFTNTQALEVQLKASVQAVQSAPLMNRSGKLFGVPSTHFRRPHRPDDRTFSMLDLLTQRASEILERAETGLALQDNTNHEAVP